jgi:hypothetical protein
MSKIMYVAAAEVALIVMDLMREGASSASGDDKELANLFDRVADAASEMEEYAREKGK